MNKRAFILAPTSLSAQLATLTGRTVPLKSTPRVTVNGRPQRVGVPGAFGDAKRESLKAAVARFNASESVA